MYRILTHTTLELPASSTVPFPHSDEPAVYLKIDNEADLMFSIVRVGENDSNLHIQNEGEYFVGPFHGPSLPSMGIRNGNNPGTGNVSVTMLAYTGRFTQDPLTGVRQRVSDGPLPFTFQRLDEEDDD